MLKIYNFKNSKIQNLLAQEKALSQVCDLYHDRSTDWELYRFLTANFNYSIPYVGFIRTKGDAIYEIVDPVIKARAARDYLLVLAQTSFDIGFILDDIDNVRGIFWTVVEEPNLSCACLIAVRGTEQQKARAVIKMADHFENGYGEWLYEKGFEVITASACGSKSAAFINLIRKRELIRAGAVWNKEKKKFDFEDKNLPNKIPGFRCVGERDFVRYYNNKIWTKTYTFNLKQKWSRQEKEHLQQGSQIEHRESQMLSIIGEEE